MYILLYYVLLSTVATLVKISQILYAMVLRLCVRVLQVDITPQRFGSRKDFR